MDNQRLGDLTNKQTELLAAIKSRKYKQIYLIGALGTSKTYAFAAAFILLASQYPKSYIPIARKTLAEVRVGTIFSFLEVLDNFNYVLGIDYELRGGLGGGNMRFEFSNGSIIQFVQLDHTIDPQWQKIKSINATACGVDEVDGVVEGGYIMLSARTGRRNQNGAPDITIATCNPNEGWVKENVYTPWKKGYLPADVLVIEFNMADSFLYGSGFYDRFKTNPKQWQQRYLYNNWEYLDDDTSLFKSRILDQIMRVKYKSSDDQFLGIDVADEGKDRTVFSHIVGNTLVNVKVYTKDDIERLATGSEQKNRVPYGHVVGREAIKYCQEHRIGYEDVAFDAVGIGVSLRDYFTSQDFYPMQFKAGAHVDSDYDMLRSEVAGHLANDMERDEFLFYEGCPFLGDLKKELLYHLYEVKAKIMCVESKIKLKQRLGRSPDLADSLFIAYWAKHGKTVGTYDTEPITDPSILLALDEQSRPITAGLIDKIF